RRRRLLWILPAASPLLVLLFPATPFFESWARQRIAGAAHGAGFELDIARLQLRPWLLRADARDVTISAIDGLEASEIRIARLTLRLRGGGRLFAEVEGVDANVVVASGAEDASEEAAGREPPSAGRLLESFRLGALHLRDARATVATGDRGLRVEVSGLEGSLARVGESSFGLQLGAAGVGIAVPEAEVEAGAVTVVADLVDDSIAIDEASLLGDDLELRLHGRLRTSDPLDGAFELAFAIASSAVTTTADTSAIEARVRGSADLRIDGEGLHVDGRVEEASVSWQEIGPLLASGSVSLSPQRVEVPALTVEGYGGTARAAGVWERDSGHQELSLGIDAIDLAALARDATGNPIDAELQVTGEADAAAEAWEAETLQGSTELRVTGTLADGAAPFSSRARARLDGGQVSVDAARAELGPGVVEAAGRLGLDGTVEGRFRGGWRDLSDLEALTSLTGVGDLPIDLAGSLEVEGSVAGRGAELEARAHLPEQSWTAGRQRVSVSGDLVADRSGLEIQGLRATTGTGEIRVSGHAPFGPEA
ncbi:MAG: hypothetical protein R3190_18970, partial [Thermoanaerobaculia bacterium]|nr:hypothetical protein [Thermoanaerobaculia bacterium]